MISMELRELFKKQHYELVSKHAAVKVCHWTKESIRGKDFCYKQKFYGIQSHCCLQMTPVVDVCNHNCLFCWRPMDYSSVSSLPENEADEPSEMLDHLIKSQKKLLIGFKGFENVDTKKLEEALNPKHVAISLAGEPTLYPKLDELIGECHKRGMSTFLVTNGTNPEVLKNLENEPTQLYISLSAPNKELYQTIHRPLFTGGWKLLQRSLELLPTLSCNTVIRLTLLKMNMINPKSYAKLIEMASPTFLECKAYMHVGFSKYRLPREEMPLHKEIFDFAKQIEEHTSYRISDQKKNSRVVLLKSL